MGLIDSFNRWKNIIWGLKQHDKRFELIEMGLENLFNEQYSNLKKDQSYKINLAKKEFSAYSQNGEDGLLLYILSQISIHNQTFIEFGIGDGRQCNAANLIINFGWKGLMIEGNSEKATAAKRFYANHPNTSKNQVNVLNKFITRENINSLFSDAGFEGDIDLLSIDIDGNDYWVWEAIQVVKPRIVVIEYNPSFGADRSVTVTYDPSFERFKKHESGWYHGASVKALEKLGQSKGYDLVGCNIHGVNAFFIRDDLNKGNLEAISSKEAFYESKKRNKICSTKQQFELIQHLPLVNI